jgi:hypothetical protein
MRSFAPVPKKKPVKPAALPVRDRGPIACEICGQNIDKNNAGSIAHHSTMSGLGKSGRSRPQPETGEI